MNRTIWTTVLVAGLLLGSALVAVPQTVTQLAGLAVAQSATQWNKLKDIAQGDAQTNGVGLMAPCLFNGVTCDRQRGTIAGGADVAIKSVSGGVTPTDSFANPTNALTTYGLNGGFNGSSWDRLRIFTADALATTGIQAIAPGVWNGASFDREREATADNLAATGVSMSGNAGFDGTNWDRAIAVSNTNNTATTTQGVRYNAPLSTWSVTNTPAVATAATVSKAAGGGTVRHVATSVTVCVAANGTAQVPLLFHLRDGATGAGTIIRTWALSAPVTSGWCQDVSGLNMTGSANTAMTIESAAAPVAASQATVTLTGYSTP